MTIQETAVTNSSEPPNHHKSSNKNAKRQSLWLYDVQTQALLQQAHEQAVEKQQKEDAEANRLYPVVRTYDEDYDQLSSEEEQEGEQSSSESSASSASEEESEEDNAPKQSASNTKNEPAANQKPKKAAKQKELTPKQTKKLQQEIHQHRVNLIKTAIPMCIQEEEEDTTTNNDTANLSNEGDLSYTHNLQLPTALLAKSEQQFGNPVSKAKAYLDLSTAIVGEKYVVVLLLQSGKFAGGVFSGNKCIQHKTMQKYTVRKGQGKAQSAQDGKRRPKSMGSQLRRQGELQLKEDVQTLLWKEWASFVQQAGLILISCPKTMVATLLDQPKGPQWSSLLHGNNNKQPLLSRKDSRIRKIPMTVGRPTFESVYMVHQVLLQVSMEPIIVASVLANGGMSGATSEPVMVESTTNPAKGKEDVPKLKEEEVDETIPLLHLHELCQSGNHAQLLDWLQASDSVETFVNRQAGKDFMTPLHYAAACCASTKSNAAPASPEDAGACVYDLLTKGHADPTVLDARLRPPYFLAGHDKVREAFRKARATLGEDVWDWKASQVGPPLSEEVLEQKKAKEAEKRRRKKQKAKEKKAKERQAQEEAAAKQAQQQAEEEKAKAEGRACDCCQKPIRGRKNVFKRLEYQYCSTKCVNDHKRELMASAALARFGG